MPCRLYSTGSSAVMIFFWPGYRLVAIFTAVLAFFTWKFIWGIGDLGIVPQQRHNRHPGARAGVATWRPLLQAQPSENAGDGPP